MNNTKYNRNLRNMYNYVEKYSTELGLQNFASLSHEAKDDIFNKAHLKAMASRNCENNVQEKFLWALFSILHAKGISLETGEDIVTMYRIYKNALYHYPQFKECSYAKQFSILHEAFMKGRLFRNHDIYVYAKETFLIFAKKGLIDSIISVDKIENVSKPFSKIWENRSDRRNYEHPSEVWEYNAIIYVMYEYKAKSGVMIRTSFHPSDLWLLLCGQT